MEVSKHINPNIIQDGSIEGDKKIKDKSIDGDKKIKNYPPLQKGSGGNSVCQITCSARGSYSHAEGLMTKTSGYGSHAEGNSTTASDDYSHSEGDRTSASGKFSHAEGHITNASGIAAHAEGYETTALNQGEHAEGQYNLSIKDKTIHTVGIGRFYSNTEINIKNAHEIHFDGKHYIYGIGGYNGTNSQTEGVKTIQEVVNEDTNAVQITYAELKSLRDTGKLVPGTQYRITDYTCTTTQAGTKSAGHVFDIIVTADDESTLNEVARAVKHEGDNYFDGCNLNAWKIWYCLDNDTNRFAWADATNGKGVIYRLIDEFNNDCPYDFKNIQFYRQWNANKSLWNTISSSNIGTPCYTFSSEGNSATTSFTDYSLTSSNSIYSNVIKKYVSSNKQTLNNICFFGNNCYSNMFVNNCYNNTSGNSFQANIFGKSCYNNIFGNNCSSNTFGDNCDGNSFGNYFQLNTFGNICDSNTAGNGCQLNTFGNNCSSNTFGDNCDGNSFGNKCYSNTFGNDCDGNSFGNDCRNNTFKYACRNNTFENGCQSNTFGGNCSGNFFGNSCQNNTFGDNCSSNSFGNSCWYNSFKNNCDSNTFGSSCSVNTFVVYCRYNYFGDGCYKLNVQNSDTASPEQQVQNYVFANGLNRSASTQMTITTTRNLSYETKVAKKSNGELKIYCEADLIL